MRTKFTATPEEAIEAARKRANETRRPVKLTDSDGLSVRVRPRPGFEVHVVPFGAYPYPFHEWKSFILRGIRR